MTVHSDHTTDPSSSAPSFRIRAARSSAGPWSTRAPSSESLQHSHAPIQPNVLKKRHSTYTLSTAHPHAAEHHPSVPPPVPDLPPLRPPRNPARSSPIISTAGQDIPPPQPPSSSSQPSMHPQPKGPSRSRPMTATGSSSTREDVTPWEFQASSSSLLDDHTGWSAQEKEKEREKEKDTGRTQESPRVKPLAPSVKSRASSAGLGLSTWTGPVSEVTPWELYPAPLTLGGNGTTMTIASSSKDVSLPSPHPDSAGHTPLPITPRKHTLPTGPVEDVTPWELEPAPPPEPVVHRVDGGGVTPGKHKEKERLKKPSKARPEPLSPPIASASIPPPPLSPSRRSLPYSDYSHSHHSAPQSVGQGTHSSYARSGGSAPGSAVPRPMPTGPVEEVTPWEMHPVPDEKLQSIRSRSHSSLPTPSSPTSSSPLPPLPTHKKTSSYGHSPGAEGERPFSSNAIPEDRSEERHSEEQELTIPDLHDFSGAATARGRASVSSSAAGSLATSGAASVASNMSMAQMEEVLPWELYPAPAPKHGGTSSGGASKDEREKKVSRTGSTSQGKGLTDFGLRRRRSTGSKAAAATAAAAAATAATSSGGAAAGSGAGPGGGKARDRDSMQAGAANVGISSSNPPPLPENAAPSSALGFPTPGPITPVASTSSTTTTSSGSRSDRKSLLKPPSNAQDLKFSTADRTILEELKANIRVREAQFKIMGAGHTVVGGGRSPGKKYHPHPREEVPYPRSYDREVVDLDVWETMFCLNICQSLTWHVFETPPTKVLDVGCGTGTWLLHCARTWKDCHFVGLDIVPLHPNLQNVGSPDLASRITWVQHNFLDVLPFQNEEFDFVHVKRISLGVPEDKWDKLFEEIQRVMKPGGAFELIEEDLFFPGRRVVEQDDDSSTRDDASSITRRNSTSSDRHRASINGHDDVAKLEHVAANGDSTPDGNPQTPTASRAGSPNTIRNGEYPDGRVDPPAERKPALPGAMTMILPHSRSAARPLLHVKTNPASGPYQDFVGIGGQMHPSVFGSSVSLLGTMGYLTFQDPLVEMIKESKRSRASSVVAPGLGHTGYLPSNVSSDSHHSSTQPPAKKTKPSPFLLRSLTQTKAPTNPRDHTILAAAWHGMLESRFVNATPLSLLTPFLEYHFKDVRTHPPLLYTFPPVAVKVEEESGDESHLTLLSESESDIDGARDAIVPRPKRPRSTKSKKSLGSNSTSSPTTENGEVLEEHRWLSMHALLKHKSPYITLDESRAYAFSPSNKSAFPLQKTNDGKVLLSNRISRLPNTTLHIDLRTLNLHLALRAKEVIACSEPMWQWVEQYQDEAKAAAASPSSSKGSRFRSDSIESTLVGSGSDADSSTEDLTRNAILEMTRDDFDQLLNNFEMDMQDKASVGNALRERFSWNTFPSPILPDRKTFDLACEKYDNWVEQNKSRQSKVPVVHRSRNSLSNSGLVPPTPDSPVSRDHHLLNQPASSPQPSTITPEIPLDDATTLASSHRHDSGLFAESLHSPSTESMPAPTLMFSRAMRVFVAWKATS